MVIQSAHVQKALALSNRQFKKLFGVKRETFHKMLAILLETFEKEHRRGGKPPKKVFVEDRLLITLQYWREYRTMEHLAYDYNTVVSNIHKAITWAENILIQHEEFRLPGKKALIEGEQKPRVVAIDVTAHTVERPKKNRKNTTPARKSVIL